MFIKKKSSWLAIFLLAIFLFSANDHISAVTSIKFWTEYDLNSFKNELVKYSHGNPGQEINWEHPANAAQYGKQILVNVAAKTPPDIATLASGRDFPKLFNSNLLVPLNDLSTGDIKKELGLNGFSKEALDFVTKDGKIYGIPIISIAPFTVYNTDLFKKAGLDPKKPPKTWNDIIKYGKKLTKDTNGDKIPDQWGYALPIGGSDIWASIPFESLAMQFDSGLVDNDGKILFNNAGGLKALNLWMDLVYKYKIVNPKTKADGYLQMHQYFQTGKVGIGMSITGNLLDVMRASNGAMPWATAVFPLPSPGTGKKVVRVNYNIIGIFKDSPHQKEAYNFLKWLLKPDNYAKHLIATNSLPSSSAVRKSKQWNEYVAAFPPIKPLVEEVLSYGLPHSRYEYYPEARKVISNYLDQALQKRLAPKEALDMAAKELDETYKKMK
jgi:sn-glycerol 3-phosphate transport system substrate-binding protein